VSPWPHMLPHDSVVHVSARSPVIVGSATSTTQSSAVSVAVAVGSVAGSAGSDATQTTLIGASAASIDDCVAESIGGPGPAVGSACNSSNVCVKWLATATRSIGVRPGMSASRWTRCSTAAAITARRSMTSGASLADVVGSEEVDVGVALADRPAASDERSCAHPVTTTSTASPAAVACTHERNRHPVLMADPFPHVDRTVLRVVPIPIVGAGSCSERFNFVGVRPTVTR